MLSNKAHHIFGEPEGQRLLTISTAFLLIYVEQPPI
jgi:hypothetical protein